MTILYVCYGEKDKKDLVVVAEQIKKDQGDRIFLALGQEADDILRKKQKDSPEYYLPTRYFFLKDLLAVTDYPDQALNQDALEEIRKILDPLNISRVLIGSSDAEIPFQIAKLISTQSIESGVILCEGDSICDGHVLLKILANEKNSWMRIFELLALEKTVKEQLNSANDSVLCCTVTEERQQNSSDQAFDTSQLSSEGSSNTLPGLFHRGEKKRPASFSEIVARVLSPR